MNIRELGELIGLVVLLVWRGIDKLVEVRAFKKEGLPPNPTRCAAHQKAINELRTDVRLIKEKLEIV